MAQQSHFVVGNSCAVDMSTARADDGMLAVVVAVDNEMEDNATALWVVKDEDARDNAITKRPSGYTPSALGGLVPRAWGWRQNRCPASCKCSFPPIQPFYKSTIPERWRRCLTSFQALGDW